MSILIATGGLDELAIDVSNTVFFGLFVGVSALIALSWWKHWLAPLKVAFGLIFVGGLLIEPWKFVVSPQSEGPYPYDHTYFHNMRAISAVWLLLFIFTTARLVRVIHNSRLKKIRPTPPGSTGTTV
jgi:hypothetical protein